MTFDQAYHIALDECNFIQAATERVKQSMIYGGHTPCYLFAIGKEVFYFGFDGVDLVKGKHTAKRSRQLIDNGDVWIIRN